MLLGLFDGCIFSRRLCILLGWLWSVRQASQLEVKRLSDKRTKAPIFQNDSIPSSLPSYLQCCCNRGSTCFSKRHNIGFCYAMGIHPIRFLSDIETGESNH